MAGRPSFAKASAVVKTMADKMADGMEARPVSRVYVLTGLDLV
jgi:hypothetical protein